MALNRIQTSQRKIPLDQIIAAQGQNPVAQGIEATGNVIGQAIAKRAQLQQQGQQLAALAKMAGQPIPDTNTLTPELYEKGLSYKTAADAKRSDRAEKKSALTLKLEQLKQDHSEVDPATGKITTYKGVTGMEVGEDEYGDPAIIKANDYKQGTLPVKGGSSSSEKTANDKLWYNIVKETNPATASSRSALGLAAAGNAKANRADTVLANPNSTPQDIAAAVKDLGSIFQGGAPTDSGTHELEYNTLANKWANLQTLVLNQPTALNSPEIKQHMRDVIAELRDVNKKTINDNFDYIESAHPDAIAQHGDSWKNMRLRAGATLMQPLPTPQQPGLPTIPVNGLSPAAQRLINKHK